MLMLMLMLILMLMLDFITRETSVRRERINGRDETRDLRTPS
jgi:hypothetical protein